MSDALEDIKGLGLHMHLTSEVINRSIREITRLRAENERHRGANLWIPISEADTSVDRIYELGVLRIANSEEYWVRDDDGRIYQAAWADDGKRAYWWDLEGQSPVDPVEFMPHPLDPRWNSNTRKEGVDHG